MEGAVLSTKNQNVAKVMCVHSPTLKSHLQQLGHHRFVNLPLSHTSEPDYEDLTHSHIML